jgi:hypothetical protein
MITNILVGAEGRQKSVTVKEWLALPLTERVGHITSGTVQFYNGTQKLTAREALGVLKTMT